MTRAQAIQAVANIGDELMNLRREPYTVGPTGLGVFRVQRSEQISAYISLAYYSRYRALGAYIGFGFPELKCVTDECLAAVGGRLNVTPTRTLANPCPAVLFPIDFFLESHEAQPFSLDGDVRKWARNILYERIILGTHAWVQGRHDLYQFLASDDGRFSWAAAEVPRRLIQVAYLAKALGESEAAVAECVRPAARALSGDADFDGCEGSEFESLVLKHFFEE